MDPITVIIIILVISSIVIGVIYGIRIKSSYDDIKFVEDTDQMANLIEDLETKTKEIENKEKLLNNKEEEINLKYSSVNVKANKRLKFTKDFLLFIDELIDVELLNNTRFDVILDNVDNTRKPNVDVDKAITEISTNVFEGIKEDVFITPYSLLSRDYLIRYIQKRTFIKYMIYLNQNVANKL